MQGGYRSAQETTSAIVPPEEPKANGKAAPGDAKKAGKVVFGGGNRLLAAKVPGLAGCTPSNEISRLADSRLGAGAQHTSLSLPCCFSCLLIGLRTYVV